MKRLCAAVGAFAASYVGWWLGELMGGGIMTQFILSTIVGGVGLYYGAKFGRRYE